MRQTSPCHGGDWAIDDWAIDANVGLNLFIYNPLSETVHNLFVPIWPMIHRPDSTYRTS